MVDEDETAGKAPRKPAAHQRAAGAARSEARRIARTMARDLKFDDDTPDSLRLLVAQAARAMAQGIALSEAAEQAGIATGAGRELAKDAARFRKEAASLFDDAAGMTVVFSRIIGESKPQPQKPKLSSRPRVEWEKKSKI